MATAFIASQPWLREVADDPFRPTAAWAFVIENADQAAADRSWASLAMLKIPCAGTTADAAPLNRSRRPVPCRFARR
jgi:hypothetical protein